MTLLNIVKVFAFWGICFLLILVLGFGVNLKDIYFIALSLEMNLAAFCIYLLGSVFLFPTLVIISILYYLNKGFSFGDILAIDVRPML